MEAPKKYSRVELQGAVKTFCQDKRISLTSFASKVGIEPTSLFKFLETGKKKAIKEDSSDWKKIVDFLIASQTADQMQMKLSIQDIVTTQSEPTYEELRAATKEYLKKNQISQNIFSKTIAVAETSFSFWVNARYPKSDESKTVKEITEKVITYFRLKKESEIESGLEMKSDFVHTDQAKIILGQINLAVKHNAFCLILGRAGLGKTYTMVQYTQGNVFAKYFTAVNKITVSDVLDKMYALFDFNFPGNSRSLFMRTEFLIESLKGTSFILFVDESQHLPYGAVNTLRQICEGAKIPIILLGNESVLDQMRGKFAIIMEQARSRALRRTLPKEISREDVQKLLDMMEVEVDEDGFNFLWGRITEEGRFRSLRILISLAIEVFKKRKFDHQELLTANAFLYN